MKFISELRQLLSDVPDFSPQKDVDVFKSVTLLKENINSYCSAHKITDTTTNDRHRESQHVLSGIQKSPPLSVKPSPPKPVKPPVPPKKPKISPTKTSSNDSGHGSNLRTGGVLRTSTVPMKTETRKEHWESNNDIRQYKSNNGGSEATAVNSSIPPLSPGIDIVNVQPSTETIAVNSVPPSTAGSIAVTSVPPPCVPPPPPPPLPVACRLLYQEERRLSCGSLPNSNCSSFSFQDEITTHKKDNLRRVTGPKSPGGTPVRTLEHTDMLQRALMKKFQLIRMHSTPKRGGLMESGSMEVSNTWSEWGASLDTHQYASDPDLTHFSSSRNMTSPPLRQSSPCSAADFESMNYSSPSRS